MKSSSPSKKQLRKFGLLVGFLFPFLIGWLLPTIFDHEIRLWTIYLGLTLISFGIFSPSLLFYPYKQWMAIGKYLGWVNSHIILGLVFIIVLQPIAIFMRFIGYDPLKTKKESLKTYREVRKYSKINLEKIF